MPKIEVLETGHVDRSDSAFPTLVQLDNDDIICGFCRGDAPYGTDGTHCAVSRDGGRTWQYLSKILGATTEPLSRNFLRLSRTGDGDILAYGQHDHIKITGEGTQKQRDLLDASVVLSRSSDNGLNWSAPQVIPAQLPGPYEISNPIIVTHDGRWLGPAASYHRKLFGEIVVLFESSDQGKTWPNMYTVFEDPDHAVGYLEQKVIECQPNRLLAVAWRQDYQKDTDIDNGFSFSNDGGRTWQGPYSTGIQGQTMTPLWLGGDRFLVLYNRRFGKQTIQMCLVRAKEDQWSVEFEDTMWDAQSTLRMPRDTSSREEINKFKFGYPFGLRLDDRTVLLTHWCEEDGVCVIRWTRLGLRL